MLRYVVRRLLLAVVLLFVVSLVTFSLMSLVIGDPVYAILGPEASADQFTIERLRQELQLDRPLPVRYVDWLGHAVTGDLGRSFRQPIPVRDAVLARLPVTLELTALAIVLAIAIAVPLGTLAALRAGGPVDVALSAVAAFNLSIPNFFLGILLIYVFALRLGWLPSAGFVTATSDPFGNLKLMLLPSLTLAAAYEGGFARYVRSCMVEVLGEDYVRTARAKGLGRVVVVGRHALRNALIPLVTVISLEIAGLFGGAVVTETVFSLPGVGTLLTESILGRDLPIVQGAVLFITAAVVLTNLAVDLLYGFLDPRIRVS
ncbi:MAG: ABC transporter permease [Chloroflexota bacterium]|nr:ABC transporter permease [Chloroflexota bacterium]MDE3193966.1 ABC transporter permease [Chloroflexota bacterium]